MSGHGCSLWSLYLHSPLVRPMANRSDARGPVSPGLPQDFNPAKYKTLRQFFGTTHEDIWKVLFKANETWPETTEDCGHDLAHPASSVSFPCFKAYPFLACSRRMSQLPYFAFLGLDKKGGADSVFGSAARGTSHPTFDEDASSGTLRGAREEGQEECQRD